MNLDLSSCEKTFEFIVLSVLLSFIQFYSRLIKALVWFKFGSYFILVSGNSIFDNFSQFLHLFAQIQHFRTYLRFQSSTLCFGLKGLKS